jgi:hypothetical protein
MESVVRTIPGSLRGGADGINDVVEAVRRVRDGARIELAAGSLLEPTSAELLGR